MSESMLKVKERPMLTATLKELPIALFLLYLAYLCVLFHGRDHRMLDYTLTFDHWWYFHQRLMNGEIAQWNPFSLLGKIAVQWNYIPLSVIFSPFLVFTKLNLGIFHNLFIIGTFLSLSVLYFTGRLLKYNRFLCLVPVVFIVSGGYRYLCALLNHSTFLFFYPLAIVCLLNALQEKGRPLFSWSLCAVLLSLSFIGSRFEFTVYVHVFIVVLFMVLALYRTPKWKTVLRYSSVGAALTAAVLALTAWQLPFLVTSTLENCRVSSGFQLSKFFDGLLLKWSLVSVLYQPALLLLVVNIALWILLNYVGKGLRCRGIKMWTFLLAGAVELALLKVLVSVPSALGMDPVRAFVPPNTHPVYANLDIILSWSGMVSVLVLITFYSAIRGRVVPGEAFSFFAAMFAGFYVAEYSWHIWPINENTHFFFMIPLFAALIPFGAVRLMLHGKAWMLAVLVVFHLIGETGFFYLYEAFGIPWLAPRATLAEIPFQIVLILEAILFSTEGAGRMISRLRARSDRLFLFGRPRSIASLTGVTVKVLCVLFAFLTLKMFLMPVGERGIPGSSGKEMVYLREFPFAETPLDDFPGRPNEVAYEAERNSDAVHKSKQKMNPLKRARVEDSVVSTSDDMFYKFLPAYSQTLNTAPLYATELSKTMRTIFIPDYDEKEGKLLKKAHPEMNPTFIEYKKVEGRRLGVDDIFGNQSTPVMILAHQKNDTLYREVMAEEGSSTPRAFLTKNVARLRRYVDEYYFLNDALKNGGSLKDRITTSDINFAGPDRSIGSSPLAYDLDFKKDDPENIVLQVRSSEDAFLALMDAWERGWRAYIDGKETKIYRGYMGTRFIEVEGGEHTVRFAYTIPGLARASVVSMMAWIGVLSCLIVGARSKSKSGGVLTV